MAISILQLLIPSFAIEVFSKLMRKAMLLQFYTFYEFNRLCILFFLDIALLSQRDVKTMLSTTISFEQELLNVFFNKVLFLDLPLMSKAETYFNVNIAASI